MENAPEKVEPYLLAKNRDIKMTILHGGSTSAGKLARPMLPLKYYVHDSIHAFRFQLIGNLRESDLADLSGCWNTARTTLGTRRLEVDLIALQSTDEAGKRWLLSLADEGAIYSPESYFRTGLAAPPAALTFPKLSFFARAFSLLRGRTEPISTRAQ